MLDDPGPDALFVHAAGVRVGGRLLLLVGASGSGKSTLTALLLTRGHRMLGDDVLRFAPSGRVFEPVPRSIKLDSNTMKLLDLQNRTNWDPESGVVLASDTTYVSPVALCRSWDAGAGRPWAVVVLEDAPHAGPAGLERRGEGEPAVRLVRSVLGAAHRPAGGALPHAGVRLLESLEDAVAFQARGADPGGLADLMEEATRA